MVETRQGDDRATVAEGFPAGNELTLAEIYARWSPLVYSIALGSLGNVSGAEDVTRQVFTQAWTSRSTFGSVDRSELSAWLVELTLSTIAEAKTVIVEPADLAERLVLVDAVSSLDVVPQRVLRMALYDDLSHAQIAERMGLSAASVKSHIRCSLVMLRARREVQAHAR